ncbi:histidinol phosphate phosphatase [Clostridium polyendosporum]|uniref:Histidinol-phosphatase n=1 Tax=Clostridium polyendosporum TaxID=69208 RepID=A0A919S2F5_9CLOT|nr:histidinol-phosphatase HisJ family protein [Clostridium polyendosporum]GIM30013.1 histidinol phosphate phosphatase [Clostridium polyendosporum]
MYLSDYHIHTNNSFDSNETMTVMCEQAIVEGIDEICFTEHFSVKEGSKSNGFIDFSKYFSEINACRDIFKGKITMKMGIEIGEPFEDEYKLSCELTKLPFDFLLGSVHNIGFGGISRYIEGRDNKEIWDAYFKELSKLSSSQYVDVVAHLDLMKRYSYDSHGNYSYEYYRDVIAEVLRGIIKNDKGIEVNTSGLRSSVKETMPSISVLKLYKEIGGEIVTIGSDAHVKGDVGRDIRYAVNMLSELGFKYLYTYHQRQPIAKKI